MSEVSESSCPKCGESLPAGAPNGLCPVCLMAGAMEPTCEGEQGDDRVPDIAIVQEAFPQLEILEVIGVGGMGVVYKAKQTSLDREVALKLLAPNRVIEAGFSDRFEREARALAAMDHPNIVTVHDFGREGDFYYLIMEYVDGVNLRQALKASRFTPEQALTIVPVICDALQYAHDLGIVHRDIKPENLLLDKSGKIKIADFGIARILNLTDSDIEEISSPEDIDESQLTKGAALGTPNYMAPEQVAEPENVDHRADIYSLGVVFYEMLTGERPAGHIAPLVKKVELDVRLDEIVLRALSDSPELRFQSATELRTQVEAFATVQNRSASSPEPEVSAGPEEKSGNVWKWLSIILGIVSVPFVLGAMFWTGTILSMESEGGSWNPARNELFFSIALWIVACLLPAVTAICTYRWMNENADTSGFRKVLLRGGLGVAGAGVAIAILFISIKSSHKRKAEVIEKQLAAKMQEELEAPLFGKPSTFPTEDALEPLQETTPSEVDRIPAPTFVSVYTSRFPAPGPDDPPLKNTHQLISTFLKAPNWQSQIPNIYQGEVLKPRISEYYKTNSGFQHDNFNMKLFQMELDEEYGGPFWVFQISFTDDSSGFPLILRVEDGILKVDWEVFTEFADRHYVKAMSHKSFSPQKFRVVANRVSSYPGDDLNEFENIDDFDCYELNPPYGKFKEFTEYAFVKKDSSVADEMGSRIGLDDDPLAVIIEIDRKKLSHGGQHYVITDFIDEGWFN